jgi:hypothetical protein
MIVVLGPAITLDVKMSGKAIFDGREQLSFVLPNHWKVAAQEVGSLL